MIVQENPQDESLPGSEVIQDPKETQPAQELTDNEVRLAWIDHEISLLNDELKKRNEEFDSDFLNMAYSYLNEGNVEEVTERWLEEVREKTKLLDEADDFGFKLFVEDIESQPDFPIEAKGNKGIRVFFDPHPATLPEGADPNAPEFKIKGRPKYRDGMRLLGDGKEENPLFYRKTGSDCFGVTPRGSGYIQIFGHEKPSLLDQLYTFLSSGKLHPVVEGVVHEMIHTFHQDKNWDIESGLTEGQAYCNGIVAAMSGFESIEKLAEHIDNGYESISRDQAKSIVTNLLFLYARGSTPKQVAEYLRKFPAILRGVETVEDQVKEIMEQEGITIEMKNKMIEKYILQKKIEIAKARDLFLDTWSKWMQG